MCIGGCGRAGEWVGGSVGGWVGECASTGSAAVDTSKQAEGSVGCVCINTLCQDLLCLYPIGHCALSSIRPALVQPWLAAGTIQ